MVSRWFCSRNAANGKCGDAVRLKRPVQILFFLFFLTSGFFFPATASVTTERTVPLVGVKIDPLGGLGASLPVHIETFMGQSGYSVVFGGSLIRSRSGTGSSYYASDGFTVMPEFRYYFQVDPVQRARTYGGVWLGYEEHGNTTHDRNGNPVEARVYGRGGGLLFGNQWFFENGFLVDIYFGPGYFSYSSSENYDLNISKGGFLVSMIGPKQSGTKVRFGITVGLAF